MVVENCLGPGYNLRLQDAPWFFNRLLYVMNEGSVFNKFTPNQIKCQVFLLFGMESLHFICPTAEIDTFGLLIRTFLFFSIM